MIDQPNPTPTASEAEHAEARISGLLEEVGLRPSEIAAPIKQRLVILEELTPTVEDEEAAIGVARRVFEVAEAAGHHYTSEEQRIVIVGTLFTDIGKSGPANANAEQSRLIAGIYAQENIPSEYVSSPLADFLEASYGEGADYAEQLLQEVGLNSRQLTLRDFYDLHTGWTLDIITGDGVPKEAIAGAVSHHRLRGDNPGGILDEHDRYTGKYDFGGNRGYDRPEKLISLLDLYDAFRRRSQLSHSAAVASLREYVGRSWDGHYADDNEVKQIVGDLEVGMDEG